MMRGFVRVGDRHVHYRRAGEGPAVVLLHASPVSGAMFLDQIRVFSERFTAIAIDTPGYGLSTPLPRETPEIADYADALVETLDALGIARAFLYGRHTGASIAVETARRHPERCALALCDGYPVFTPGESERYLTRYLVPFVPTWDGSHLSFWWLRYRDQHVFWPWDLQETRHRADADVPDVDFLHRGFTQIAMAGDGYRIGYAAAFRHDSVPALRETRARVMLTSRPGDSLHASFPSVPPLHEKRELPRDTVPAAHAEVAIMAEAGGATPPAAERAPRWADRRGGDRVMLSAGRGGLHARVFGKTDGRAPIVAIAPLPGGFGGLVPLLEEIGRRHPVLALEAPGQSDSETGDPPDVEAAAGWIREALAAFGCPLAVVLGIEGSAAIAVELARTAGAFAILLDPPAVPDAVRAEFAEAYTVDLTPHVDGRHVPVTWSFARDERLWMPFYRRTRAAALAPVAGIDADTLHARVTDLLKQPAGVGPALAALWRHPLAHRLDALAGRAVVIAAPEDRFRAALPSTARRVTVESRAALADAVADEARPWA